MIGDLGLSSFLIVQELWNQFHIVRNERQDITNLQVQIQQQQQQQQLAPSTTVNGIDVKNMNDTMGTNHNDDRTKMINNNDNNRITKPLFDLPRALAAKTITEFDDAFIAPIYGFRDCWDYYRKTSSIHFLEDIVVPTLVINAEDGTLLFFLVSTRLCFCVQVCESI